MSGFKARDKEFVAGTYGRFDLELVSGKGAVFCDVNGKEYIDLGSGIGVNIFGVADDEWVAAVTAQLSKLQHASNLYYTEPCTLLAEALCKKSGMSKVFFSNSGAEANECAIKAARKYYSDAHGGAEGEIITLKNSFHGRTVTTLSATGQDVFHKNFGPFTDGFRFVTAGDCEELENAVGDKTAAVMIEMIQGEGGVNPLSQEFVDRIKKLAEKHGFLIISDEVQTGNGRTGKYFACEHYGLKPDIISTAKGLGGGLPIGATLFSSKTASVLGASDHGSTFGGNPVAAAGALSIVNRVDDALLCEVTAKGEYIRKSLEGAKGVKSIAGMGLMLGIETEGDAKRIVAECINRGVVALTAKTKVRLLPPLNITYDQLDKALNILKEVIANEALA
ncbi:MAG: acetylornithine/succinylornithine family transaminase [Clostridia bacterium]|nr:acetylornithine/succinylornithine family transaminase [Clostridia bacterium]